jgi:hypothetical protein
LVTCEDSQSLIVKLQELVQHPIAVRINNNHSTFLSVRRGIKTTVSVHRLFCQAPDDVLKSLAAFIQKATRQERRVIQRFIVQNSHLLPRSQKLPKLQTKGQVWDLQLLFDRLNRIFFEGKLSLHLTWFGEKIPMNISRCTLGLYFDNLQLVKIHSLLDRSFVPLYVVESVLFHEMLHAVCPGSVNGKGRALSHNAEFKRREREFPLFLEAEKWIQMNSQNFFKRR